ncbi:hypothetical protein [Halomonas colorata]|uniref:Uncharacterized protein n=2 Tax=Halomonas TaxID=2745 RepID=A0ABR9G3K4_9GAMM|nr:hypothetical protein [Halomonas colorata]MBE0465483.1 hypothetical protein [Halomonas colorata]
MPTQPQYEALDAQGYPYMREARVIGELPLAARRTALDAAITTVGNECGLTASKPLSFGLPVFEAFGLNRREASRHAHSKLLLTQGSDLSLEYAN